eukprot:g9832.t1
MNLNDPEDQRRPLVSNMALDSLSEEELNEYEKKTIRSSRAIKHEKRLRASQKKQPCSYYLKNIVIIILIVGYLFCMYGPFRFMNRILNIVKSDVHSATIRNILEASGLLFLGFFFRFLDKMVVKFLGNTLCGCLCNQRLNDTTEFLLAESSAEDETEIMTASVVYQQRYSFKEACKNLKYTPCHAYSLAMFRLFFIHWAHPILYWVTLFAYWDVLNVLQLILGGIVGVREGVYLIFTLICLIENPTFLLVDINASRREDLFDFLIYVFAPDKFLYFCLGFKKIWILDGIDLSLVFLLLLDLVSAAALLVAIDFRISPPLLMVGYCITTIGGMLLLGLLTVQYVDVSEKGNKATMPNVHGILRGTQNPQRKLDFGPIDLTDKDCQAIKRLLDMNHTLVSLDFSNSRGRSDKKSISDAGIISITKGLRNNNTLKYINLLDNHDFDTRGLEALKSVFEENHNLSSVCGVDEKATEIKFDNKLLPRKLKYQDAYLISLDISKNELLRSIDLCGNELGDNGATTIFEVLKKNTKIEYLDLGHNGIGDIGAYVLGQMLQRNSVLKIIYMDDNQITDKGAVQIGIGLQKNQNLFELHLESNEIGYQGGKALKKAAKGERKMFLYGNEKIDETQRKSLRKFRLNSLRQSPGTRLGRSQVGLIFQKQYKRERKHYDLLKNNFHMQSRQSFNFNIKS